MCLWLDKEASPWLMSPSWSAQREAFKGNAQFKACVCHLAFHPRCLLCSPLGDWIHQDLCTWLWHDAKAVLVTHTWFYSATKDYMFFPMGVLRSWRIQLPPTNVKGEHYVAHLRLSAPPEKESTSQHIFFFRLFTPVSFHWGLSFGYNTFYDWDWISVGKVLVLWSPGIGSLASYKPNMVVRAWDPNTRRWRKENPKWKVLILGYTLSFESILDTWDLAHTPN